MTAMPRLQQACRAAGWIGTGAIVILSLLPGSERPHTGMPGQFEHVLAYAMTAGAFGVGYPETRARLACLALLLALAVLLETAQIWVPGRVAQAIDALASGVGALAGVAAGILALRLGRRLCARRTDRRSRRSSV